MEGMTNEQYEDNKRTLLLLILEILKNCETIEEAQERVEDMIDEMK